MRGDNAHRRQGGGGGKGHIVVRQIGREVAAALHAKGRSVARFREKSYIG